MKRIMRRKRFKAFSLKISRLVWVRAENALESILKRNSLCYKGVLSLFLGKLLILRKEQ